MGNMRALPGLQVLKDKTQSGGLNALGSWQAKISKAGRPTFDTLDWVVSVGSFRRRITSMEGWPTRAYAFKGCPTAEWAAQSCRAARAFNSTFLQRIQSVTSDPALTLLF